MSAHAVHGRPTVDRSDSSTLSIDPCTYVVANKI